MENSNVLSQKSGKSVAKFDSDRLYIQFWPEMVILCGDSVFPQSLEPEETDDLLMHEIDYLCPENSYIKSPRFDYFKWSSG